MLTVSAVALSRTDPLSGLSVLERPAPQSREGWTVVDLRAATLNRHDLWSLQGVGLRPDQLPRILGCDGAGVDAEGREVIIFPIVNSPGWRGPEPHDLQRSLFSEAVDGTFAEQVLVPAGSLLPKPAGMDWLTAANCSMTWLTAYRMLFTQAGVRPGDLVLVQGAGGGVNSAVVQLGSAAGLRVWVTSRDESRRARALSLGAERVFEAGARLPDRVDAVIDNVGAATWSHSVNVLRPGGCLVTCGATSGDAPEKAELTKIFFRELRVQGSTAGTMAELHDLAEFVVANGIHPVVDEQIPLSQARRGFEKLAAGDVFGKIFFTV